MNIVDLGVMPYSEALAVQLECHERVRQGEEDTLFLHGFVRTLEEIVIRSAAAFGVEAARWEGRPGVWIGNRKLCSLGMCVRHWVSFHGFALNVGNDLSLFSAITLCGLHDAEATSLSRECGDDSLSMQEVKDVCTREFQTLFADPPVAPC